MKVLTVYAHHDPRSFCHAVLERFTAGLTTGGHASEVVDLHAIKFDPVFRGRDMASYIDADVPSAVLEEMGPEAARARRVPRAGAAVAGVAGLRGKSPHRSPGSSAATCPRMRGA